MDEFDYGTERCHECDGHWTHASDCSLYTGPSLLSVQERVAVRALVAGSAR